MTAVTALSKIIKWLNTEKIITRQILRKKFPDSKLTKEGVSISFTEGVFAYHKKYPELAEKDLFWAERNSVKERNKRVSEVDLKEVKQLLKDGMTLKDIAIKVGVSFPTLHTMVHNNLSKKEASSLIKTGRPKVKAIVENTQKTQKTP